MKLFAHQIDALDRTANKNRVAYYHDMGLGKTFTGAEKMRSLGAPVNLVICQKSKVGDWLDHFKKYYPGYELFDLTDKKQLVSFIDLVKSPLIELKIIIGVINYDLVYRRPELLNMQQFTLMLDESSIIQNETIKRSRFIMRLKYKNLILLSGTPTGGKYERLYSQLKMLGYDIRKTAFYNMYVVSHIEQIGGYRGPAIKYRVIDGYKNVDHLKRKMRRLGCDFLKTNEVMDLPGQQFNRVNVPTTKYYNQFKKAKMVVVDGVEIVSETILTDMLYLRQLCGAYCADKLQAFSDLLDSTDDGLIVFYNFNNELVKLREVAKDHERPISEINGTTKDLSAYDGNNNAVVLVQYQAGAMGLNLQKYNKLVYFTPPLSSELYEQSKKRIHRIGQQSTCFYYQMVCKNSIEEDIYNTLAIRKNYTDELFKQNYQNYFV